MNSLPAFRTMRRIHRSSCLPTIVWCRGSEFRRRGDGYNHHFVLAAIVKFSVETAASGSTILVCAGTYQGTVNIIGHDKDRLKIIAAGSQDEVILQGDHTQEDGFHGGKSVSAQVARTFL